MHRYHGFKLLELTFVLLLLGLLLNLGGQGLVGLVQTTQARATVHQIHTAFRLARQTAVEERQLTTLCVLDADNQCQADWQGTLTVFLDPDNTRRLTDPAQLVRQFELTAGVRLSTHPSIRAYHQYDLLGQPRGATGGHVRICPGGQLQEAARIIIGPGGRTRVEWPDNTDSTCS
ncbi:hypothetical protein E4656_16945 [Natronospirillum operosum]|uniref:Type II secretion system protein H n=1 Tax=Natronospirillum operosum TaxID=2759953 RepID=A0A4Z0WAT8_9GAMM|nr:GspH/FimT family protein [Natronospirillum operosum]TGG91081.1 hypothetical protein E4656_16945 [Natronospirillum operosum]